MVGKDDKKKSSSKKEKSSSKEKSRSKSKSDHHEKSATSLRADQSQESLREPNPSIDFEAGRAFERTTGNISEMEFQRIWRAARGLPSASISPPTLPHPSNAATHSNQGNLVGPPPTDLPLPAELDASLRFDRFDSDFDGHINLIEFESLMSEWERERAGSVRALGIHTITDASRSFQLYDSDGDGRMSKHEFVTLIRVERQRQASGGYQQSNGFQFPNHRTAPLQPSSPSGHRGLSGYMPTTASLHHTSSPYESMHAGGRSTLMETKELPASYAFFDETAGLPITSDGADAAQHAGHKVTSLKEAFQSRLAKLQEQLVVGLSPKRDRLANIIESIRNRVDQVQNARLAVERETTVDYESIIERLRSNESVKLSSLHQAASQFQAEVEVIDRLSAHVEETASSSAMLSLIQKYPDLSRAIDRMSKRGLPHEPESLGLTGDLSDADPMLEFPREMKDRLNAVAREPKYEEALTMKDRLLWEMLQEHRGLEDKLEKEKLLNEEYSQELSHWLELTDKLTKEVGQLRKIAGHCEMLQEERRELLEIRQEDQEEIRLLRAQNQQYLEDYADIRQSFEALIRSTKSGGESDDGKK